LGLRDEILEQPSAVGRLLADPDDQVARAARHVLDRGVRMVFLAARGSSDNAGLYAKYLWGAFNSLPVAQAAPSLFTVYHRPPVIAESLVVAISQSGQSPDITSVVLEGRRQGALTLAITNDVRSPLAMASELVIDIMAGPELAVAATKTYTTELVAIAMLSAALSEDAGRRQWLARTPELVEQAIALDAPARSAAERHLAMQHCAVLGRGFNYATAFEWALKLKELARVIAEPYSPADFEHGPVALAQEGFPVLAVVPTGPMAEGSVPLLKRLTEERQVELLLISNDEAALALARTPLRLAPDLPEWLSPIIAIVPAQLLCYNLARARGLDTEDPRGLTKVTRTV
jgi:glutamine---fructose-6-phosphate transaminase (isomerizing)